MLPLPTSPGIKFIPFDSVSYRSVDKRMPAILVFRDKQTGELALSATKCVFTQAQRLYAGYVLPWLYPRFQALNLEQVLERLEMYYIPLEGLEKRYLRTVEFKNQLMERFDKWLMKEHPPARLLKTEERDRQILQLRAKGKRIGELAFTFKVSQSTVMYVLEKNGLGVTDKKAA